MMTRIDEHVAAPISLLYVPAVKPHLFSKALATEAAGLIFDLEDSVLTADKARAREYLGAFLAENPRPEKPVWVRVNGFGDGEDTFADLAAVDLATIAGIVLPKIELEGLKALNRYLDQSPTDRVSPLPIIGLLETAQGVLDTVELARQPRILTLGIGKADLFAELRIEVSAQTESVFEHLAIQLVIACAAAGIAAPIAPVELNLKTTQPGLSNRYFQLGFRSQTAIHPAQCASINEAFTPSEEEYRQAETLLRAFADSGGTWVTQEGRFVDRAVIRQALEVRQRFLASLGTRSASALDDSALDERNAN